MFFLEAFFPVYSAHFQLVYLFVAFNEIDFITDQHGSKSALPNIGKNLIHQLF
jgi:hypothetical protein